MTKDCLEWRSLEMKSGFFSTIRTKNINDNFEKHQRNRPSREDLRPKWYFACGGIGKELFILSWCPLVVPERWTLQSATGTNLCRSDWWTESALVNRKRVLLQHDHAPAHIVRLSSKKGQELEGIELLPPLSEQPRPRIKWLPSLQVDGPLYGRSAIQDGGKSRTKMLRLFRIKAGRCQALMPKMPGGSNS